MVAPLEARLLGVSHAFRGDPNPGLAGENWPEMAAADGGGRTRSDANLKLKE